MTYRFGYMAFVVLSRKSTSGTCGCKGKLLEWLWMWAACAAIASACARVDCLRGGLPRCAVACEAPAGRGNPVCFWCACC